MENITKIDLMVRAKGDFMLGRAITSCHDYIRLLEGCISSNSLRQCKSVHQHLLKNINNLQNSSIALDKLTRVYISFDNLRLARRVFNSISKPERQNNVLLWNQMIRAYAWAGPFEEAIDLYHELNESGVKPNKYTYPFALKACSALRDVDCGKWIHEQAKMLGLDSDVYVSTALVDLYVKCGLLDEAHQVFDKISSRDVVAWNAMIAGSSFHGRYKEATRLLVQMQEVGLSPNSSTVVGLLPAIGEANELRQGKAVHGYFVRMSQFCNFNDVVARTALLDMYAKCGCLSYVWRIFDGMSVKNEVTWSAMIGACVSCDSSREALKLFRQVMVKNSASPSAVMLGAILRACAKLTDLSGGRQIHGSTIKLAYVSDIMLGNTLVSLYSKCGDIEDAMRFFNEMDLKDVISYNAALSGCIQNGNAEEALNIFHKMQLIGIEPNVETMMGFLPACSQLAALLLGTCGHSYSVVQGFTASTSICNTLIDMYSKCGKIDVARLIFDRMSKRDVVSWNTMIAGYGIHGLGLEAVSLFQAMKTAGFKPDDVSFICLLCACSHSGLVEEGRYWFATMRQDFNFIPRMEHYLCMVDLLGRGGLMNEAYSFILRMPFDPDVRVWSSLLAACRIHKNIQLGEEVSKNIQSIGPESTGNFVLLSNIYSSAGRWDDAEHIRTMQRKQGFKKRPGCSWVEINGVVHAFVGGDRSHHHWPQINNKLDELLVEMKKLGYGAENSLVFQNVEEEEKEQILLYHSEKLAVAYAVITLSPRKPILVTKNLRVCVDCHEALKYISIITDREITVRDASRFHHFRDGDCNCGDFW